MRRKPHVRFCERLGVKFLWATHLVMGFEKEADAMRMLADLKDRLAKFGLLLHQDKTRLIEFGRFAALNRQKRGERRPETFAFLGFTHWAWFEEAASCLPLPEPRITHPWTPRAA